MLIYYGVEFILFDLVLNVFFECLVDVYGMFFIFGVLSVYVGV